MMWIETGRSSRCVDGDLRAAAWREKDGACVWTISRVLGAVAKVIATGSEDDVDGARLAVEMEMRRIKDGRAA